jgi:secreted PhoX family phosphatase
MKNIARPQTLTSLGLVAGVLLVAGVAVAQAGFVTASKPYVISISPEYAVQPILSSGDRLPRTSNPSQQFQFVGIPDGMGAYEATQGRTVLYINHEFGNTALSEPVIGQPLNKGAIVSRLVLARDGSALSGDRAYDIVFNDAVDPRSAPAADCAAGCPAADASNSTPGFSRFCSGSMEFRDAGFDRPIYFAGEESGGTATFDGLGGLGIVVFENNGQGELHTMPDFGRFPWENTLAQPRRRQTTVLMGMEDGPASTDNQLYMYVAEKDYRWNASPMERNGLVGGKMYTFVSDTPGVTTEEHFFALATPSNPNPTITGHWVVIPTPELMTDAELEAASDALGAFGFVRTEDGAFNPQDPDEYFFVTTGSGGPNQLGAMYKMRLNRRNPIGPATIQLVFDSNKPGPLVYGPDRPVSPDNIGIDRNWVMINEDGTTQSRAFMAGNGRDAAIWRLDKDTYQATRIAELFPPGRDKNFGITSGIWETTGIIPAEAFSGEAWFVNVQAHAPTAAPAANTVEDGQLLLLRRTHFDALGN